MSDVATLDGEPSPEPDDEEIPADEGGYRAQLWPVDLTDDCRVIDRALKFLANRHFQVGAGRDLGTGSATDDESERAKDALDNVTVAACDRLVRFFVNDLLTPVGGQF